jgi:hypothetical protein
MGNGLCIGGDLKMGSDGIGGEGSEIGYIRRGLNGDIFHSLVSFPCRNGAFPPTPFAAFLLLGKLCHSSFLGSGTYPYM